MLHFPQKGYTGKIQIIVTDYYFIKLYVFLVNLYCINIKRCYKAVYCIAAIIVVQPIPFIRQQQKQYQYYCAVSCPRMRAMMTHSAIHRYDVRAKMHCRKDR
jgi:hypothetical protein